MQALALQCPICDASNPPAAGRIASAFSTTVSERTFLHPPYGVTRCIGCNAYFKSARLSAAELSDYYARLAYESFESEALLPPDRMIVDVAAGLSPGSRILDYGCGVGRSLAPSASRHRCFGVEPNERAARVAAGRGITILDDAVLDEQYASFFDLVVMSDVYEHLARPVEIVRRMAACLKPGGKLILVTGLADSIEPRELLAEFWYFRIPGHLHMASREHLRWLGSRAGLVLEDSVALCHYEPDFVRDTLQRIKLWAYAATHLAPGSLTANLVRRLPVVGRAAAWENAPMLSCGRDHVFASFRKTESSPK